MSSLSAQVARAHVQWLQPLDELYTQDDIEDKCGQINDIIERFSTDSLYDVESSDEVEGLITALSELIDELERERDELQEIEENQDPRQEDLI
ncbi:hypothetical protein [Methanospirillum sp.]